ncbi:hypothetical protein R5R35_011730 [Gryllus longicercus]|uniref:MARVEL domain-containing protein n=1 Tax=Gryllus longicercus TaxID=2509291 RepID=A0AAN9YZC9_9ORTH
MAATALPVTLKQLKQPGFVLKFIEIAMLLATTLVARLGNGGHPTSFHKMSGAADTLGHGVCLAYLIISPVLLIGYVLGEVGPQRRKMEFIFNCLGALLLLVAGAVAVDFWRSVGMVPAHAPLHTWEQLRALAVAAAGERTAGLSLGCLSLLTALLYLLDAFFGYRMGLSNV